MKRKSTRKKRRTSNYKHLDEWAKDNSSPKKLKNIMEDNETQIRNKFMDKY
jgi:hypothetical protein